MQRITRHIELENKFSPMGDYTSSGALYAAR
jgi:hypothetical protein